MGVLRSVFPRGERCVIQDLLTSFSREEVIKIDKKDKKDIKKKIKDRTKWIKDKNDIGNREKGRRKSIKKRKTKKSKTNLYFSMRIKK